MAAATTRSSAATETITITASDVRQLMGFVVLEIGAICRAAGHAARNFNLDAAMTEISLFVLNDVISSIMLQIYIGSELIREYRYVISDSPLAASGPPADKPPLGYVPPGARIRLAVAPNPHQSKEFCAEWFARLGWSSAAALTWPKTQSAHTYGTFSSGGLAIERQLLSNPKYDEAIS